MKLLSYRKKVLNFSIDLIDYDATLKKEFSIFVTHKIFDLIGSIPKIKDNTNRKVQPLNLSLYSD